jgi:tRNA(Ile)-lysidine synthase
MEPDPVPTAFRLAAETGLMPPGAAILLAVSGGGDSMALLHGAARRAPTARWRLAVAHVHHGWRKREADRDLDFVAEHARRLGLEFLFRCRDARREARELKLSPEAGARHARYEALAEMAREARTPLIASAHHLDDRLESYWMARARGVKGAVLAGPRRRREDGVVRPMLDVTRRQIREFLAAIGVSHRRDATNGDLRFTRNRARRELARIAREEGDAAIEEMAREVRRLDAERERLEREFGDRVLPAIHKGPATVLADAVLLSGLETALQRRAIDAMAAPFSRPGRSPVTGREAEQILQRIGRGSDFRFEAGRRVRFERRGRIFKAAPVAAILSGGGNNSPGESVILKAAEAKESSL